MVEAVSLQELRKLVIGHNGQGHGSGVFIEKVTVKETDGDMEVVFPCNQWLDDHEADGLTERELRPSSEYLQKLPLFPPLYLDCCITIQSSYFRCSKEWESILLTTQERIQNT